MREILFRGKRIDTGEWVYGSLIDTVKGYAFIVDVNNKQSLYSCTTHHADRYGFMSVKVDPATVGQFTGLTDKNGKKIFEGDIVQCWDEHSCASWMAVVEFGNPNCTYSWGWQLRKIRGNAGNTDILLWVDADETGAYIEVIGTIHDKEATP